MAESGEQLSKARVLPPTHGKLASTHAMEREMFMKPDLYVLDTVESSIAQVQSLMEQKGKQFDPSQGLISFACADAYDEGVIADAYLKGRPRTVRDFLEDKQVTHYDNLHLYDIHMDDDQGEAFNLVGNAHHINIFKALAQSGRADVETPQASLFIMKGIDFFGTEGNQTDSEKRQLRLFRNKLPNFLTDTALVFITADSLALKKAPGFTRIHIEDRAVEKESHLGIYLYQRPPKDASDNIENTHE